MYMLTVISRIEKIGKGWRQQAAIHLI